MKLKALILDLSVGYGGSSSRVLGLLRFLADTGSALAGLDSGAVVMAARNEGLPVYSLGTNKTEPQILLRLIKLIKKGGFQVIDTQNIQSKFWGSLAANFTDITLVSTLNSWYANEHGNKSIKGKIYTAFELASNKHLDFYITVSEQDRYSLLQSNIPGNRIDLIYNAVKTPQKLSDGWLRNNLNLPANAIICLAVGRLVPIKGYDILIDAVKIAINKIPNLFCIIVGEGESREALTTQINKNDLTSHVLLVGYYEREKALAAIASSDIFVMPSRYEGTPIALLEAASMARPIVASATGGIPELVKHEEHALLVPPENTISLAEALVRIGSSEELAINLGLNAQKHIQENFSLSEQVRKTLSAYQKAFEFHYSKKRKS